MPSLPGLDPFVSFPGTSVPGSGFYRPFGTGPVASISCLVLGSVRLFNLDGQSELANKLIWTSVVLKLARVSHGLTENPAPVPQGRNNQEPGTEVPGKLTKEDRVPVGTVQHYLRPISLSPLDADSTPHC